MTGRRFIQSARRSGVRIIGACGGRGTCGTCRVLIVEGEIDDANEKMPPGGGIGEKNRDGCAPAKLRRHPTAPWRLPRDRWRRLFGLNSTPAKPLKS